MFCFSKFQPPPIARRTRSVRMAALPILLCGAIASHAARADNMVTDWNNELLLITQQTSGNLVAGPPEVAREIAQVGAAMSDAVNAATGSTIASFAYAGGPAAAANANVAAATAAYTALTNIFTDPVWSTPIATLSGSGSNTSNTTLATNVILPELRSFLASSLSSAGLSSPGSCATTVSALCNGYNLGITAANAVDASSTFNPVASGAAAAITQGLKNNAPVGSNVTPGVYVPPTTRPEMFPTWGTTTPTGMTQAQLTAATGSVSGPPALNSAAYATALLQAECTGSSVGQANLPSNIQSACAQSGFVQTKAQATANATAALFWNDPGTTIQPPGHWLQIANSALTSQNASLLQSAQLTALLGEVENNAGIAAWTEKYQYNLWRPVTAIRACDSSGSGTVSWNSNFTTCDPSWSSLIATPPHPDYLAGHPAFSGGAATVLADFFGTDNISNTSTSDYYCNGGTANFNSANLVVSCSLNGTTYYICSATTTPDFVNGLPVDCTDGVNTYPVTQGDCNTITSNGTNNGSPLICPITETFSSFSDASSGTMGAEYSRVAGGIHTPFSVQDALALGNTIGQVVALNAGLAAVPEPSSLALCGIGVLSLVRLRRRRTGA